MRQGGGALFLIAQMREDSVDDVLVFDTGDDPDRSTAAAADLDVYTEDAFKALRPGHGGMTLGGRPDFRTRDRHASAAFGWRDQPSPAMVRREDAMESREIDPRLRYQSS